MNTSQELVFPKSISKFSPPSTLKTVLRSSALGTINHYLDNFSTVIIEGDKNIGKTTVLSQIVENYIKDAVVLFISDRQKITVTDNEICKDLYLQVKSIYDTDTNLGNLVSKKITLDKLRDEFSNLQYYLKINGKKATFILDGVLDLDIKNDFVSKLFLNLPFDKNIKFIISTNADDTSKYIQGTYRRYSISILDISEIKDMIPACSEKQASDLLRVYGGMPDRISTISRLVENGESIDSILNNDCESANELYEYEFNLAVKESAVEDILGVIAFSLSELSSAYICSIFSMSEEELSEIIKPISFIVYTYENVSLASPGYYSFIKNKLRKRKDFYIDLHIENFNSKNRNDIKSPDLIKYYSAKGDCSGVISHLNDEQICNIYESTSSISELSRSIQIGLEAATEINDSNSVNKFNLLKCAFTNINKSEVVVSELECYLTEGDHARALKLIDSNGSYEEKLQLYCIYAIYQKKNKVDIRKDVSDKINFLYSKIATMKLGVEKATDIAADLLPVFPDKALKIINNLDELDSAGQNKSDAAFYRMSLLTITRHGESLGDDLSKLSSNEDRRTAMFKSVEVFSPDSPAEKILEHVSTINESGDKIFLLRAWLLKNYKKRASIKLLEEILNISTDATDFSIDASLFSDISRVLTLKNLDGLHESYQRITSHLDTLKEKGPTLEYAKLVINICIFEKNNGIRSSKVDELYKYLSEISDKSIALSSLSVLSLNLTVLERNDLKDTIDICKESLFGLLLKTDAFHVDIFREAIENEAVSNLKNAINWCLQLNTLDRRSKAISIALYTVFSRRINFNSYKFNDIVSLLRQIKNENFREDVYELLVDYYFSFHNSKSNFTKLKRVIGKIKSNYVKSKCYIRIFVGANKSNNKHINLESIESELEKSISLTDGFENKVELNFEAHKKVYKFNTKSARKFKEEALLLKSKHLIKASDLASYNKASLDLGIRCVFELEKHGLNHSNDIEFLISKINTLGSDIDRSYYFSRLASCFQKNKNIVQSESIIEKSILPILDGFEDKDSKEFAMCCYHCLPIVFSYHFDTFQDLISSVHDLYRNFSESIISRVVDYTLNDCLIYDPYSSLKKKNYPKLTGKSIREVAKVINLSQDDNTIIITTKKILDALKFLKRKSKVTRIQIEETVSIITSNYSRFPFKDGINHDGYLVLLKAIVKNFDDKLEPLNWDEILEKARKIENNSDRAFLLAEIASLMPEKSSHIKKAIFSESETSIKQLSSELEKLNRYSVLCENSLDSDRKASQKFFKSALEMCAKGDNSNSKEAKLRFIDMVSRFDESFSSSLVTMNDDDPARVQTINEAIKRKREQEELEKKFRKSESENDQDFSKEYMRTARVAWNSLAEINAKSSHFNKSFDLSKVIVNSREYNVDYYYKILSFYIHYLAEVYNGENNCNEYIKPIFDLVKANISIVSKLFTLEEKSKIDNNSIVENDNFIVFSDNQEDFDKALEFLITWFTSTKSNELTIIDPYVDFKSIEIIAKMVNRDPDVTINIITSVDTLKKLKSDSGVDFSEGIEKYWNDNIAKGDMPSFKFSIIKYGKNKDFPIHDRWIYTDSSMLYSGSSLSGFGNRVAQLKRLDASDMRATVEKVTPIITGEQQYFNGERLSFSVESF